MCWSSTCIDRGGAGTVEQIIRFTPAFFAKWRDDLARRYLQMFELPPAHRIPDLSKGMRSKLLAVRASLGWLEMSEMTEV
jgi:ABC-type multidrug transport system ATPase subunit